jgi:carbamoyltransferase
VLLISTFSRLTNGRWAGGPTALNCVANGKILAEGIYENIWVQPAAGDAGGSVGAALAAYQRDRRHGAKFTTFSDQDVIDRTAKSLSAGKAVGWMQGRMEFGPRALGNRSILGDPRSPTMQKMLNLKVKYRESFRPFAPSVLREDAADWFELDGESPYMLLVAGVRKERRRAMTHEEQSLFEIDKLNVPRSDIPAVTHVDYSARVQTVHQETNPRYHALLSRFKALTGCPVLVNTSFNVRGEPIVCTANDAFRLLHGNRNRIPRGRQLLPREGPAGPRAQARLQGRVRAGLKSRSRRRSSSSRKAVDHCHAARTSRGSHRRRRRC